MSFSLASRSYGAILTKQSKFVQERNYKRARMGMDNFADDLPTMRKLKKQRCRSHLHAASTNATGKAQMSVVGNHKVIYMTGKA